MSLGAVSAAEGAVRVRCVEGRPRHVRTELSAAPGAPGAGTGNPARGTLKGLLRGVLWGAARRDPAAAVLACDSP